jgi:hypothetical protein
VIPGVLNISKAFLCRQLRSRRCCTRRPQARARLCHLSNLSSTLNGNQLLISAQALCRARQQPGCKSMPIVANESETSSSLRLRDCTVNEESHNSIDNISGEICKKVLWRDRKRLRQLHNVLQSHIPLSALYPANVIAMQPCPFCKLFLRVATFITELPQCVAESGLNGACCHTLILES